MSVMGRNCFMPQGEEKNLNETALLRKQILKFFEDPIQRERVGAAIDYAILRHKSETRDEGSPYVNHPLSVALIVLSEIGIVDEEAAILAILHDVAEKVRGVPDSGILGEVSVRFSPEIAEKVDTLTRKIGSTREERDAYYTAKILQSPYVVRIVKVADRIHNVRSLKLNPSAEKVVRYIGETEEQIIPIAKLTSSMGESLLRKALEEVEARR
jgi:(p)ppGpp synthase/HD superfamily hydrolase